MKKTKEKVIPINHIEKSERCALVPGYNNSKQVRRLKELTRAKGNCRFAKGVPAGLIDFIYRSVVKLKLTEKELVFSRGQVKKGDMPLLNAVAITELDWDCGTSIKIPKMLRYSATISLSIEGENHDLRLMEIIVLRGLLGIAYPGRKSSWYPDMAALIIAKGWPAFDMDKHPDVSRRG